MMQSKHNTQSKTLWINFLTVSFDDFGHQHQGTHIGTGRPVPLDKLGTAWREFENSLESNEALVGVLVALAGRANKPHHRVIVISNDDGNTYHLGYLPETTNVGGFNYSYVNNAPSGKLSHLFHDAVQMAIHMDHEGYYKVVVMGGDHTWFYELGSALTFGEDGEQNQLETPLGPYPLDMDTANRLAFEHPWMLKKGQRR